ncbi:DNA mismatch repair protein MSH2 [Nematocida sp. AWRm77]|nr:DNA mismatch repair protein MSH2 [Nematocida sp. AWRm77]
MHAEALKSVVRIKFCNGVYTVSPGEAGLVREVLGEKGSGEFVIPPERIDTVVSKLVMEKGCKIEEYAEINGKEVKTREASPGHWMEFAEYLVKDVDTAKTAGVCLSLEEGVHRVCVAVVCTIEQSVVLFDFRDTEIFTTLMHVLYEHNVKEAVYRDGVLEKLFASMGIACHRVEKKSKHVEMEKISLDMVEKVLNIQTGAYKKASASLSSVLRMDSSVSKAVLDGEINLWGEINCSTLQGKRLLRMYFRQPSSDRGEIERRHRIVEEIQPCAASIKACLWKAPDILVVCKRLGTNSVGLSGILNVIKTIKVSKKLLDLVLPVASLQNEVCLLQEACKECEDVVEQVHGAVDPHTLEIRAEYNSALQSLHAQRKETEKEILLEYNREAQRLGLHKKKASLEYSTQHGHHIKIPRAETTSFLGAGVIQISAQKSGVLFTTGAIKKLGFKFQSILSDIYTETKKVVLSLKTYIQAYQSWLEALNHITAVIDVFASFSVFAETHGFVKPAFSESAYVLEDVYHPLLPALHRRQEALGVSVPEITKNTFELGSSRFCVLTGPNMGGKTTFLKTVALVTILAQSGCFVPARKACIPIFKSLFIRIGASDAPDKNISTFMAEMIDISKILNEAGKDSLVIIDELGRGTSDADGYAIAQAATEHILSLNALTLFATHFYGICQVPGVVNKQVGCVEVEGTPIMTYKIEPGEGSHSYGINVARHVGFPKEVLAHAESLLGSRPEQ